MLTVIENLSDLLGMIQSDSIVSRTFHKDDRMRAILFGFDAGQELSEHTSSQSAIIQLIQGDALVTLGDEQHDLKAGCWIHMPPNLKHSIHAKTPLLMLLMMFGKE